MAFLVADAPPHDKDLQITLDAALGLRLLGVRVYGLAASGVATTAEYLMRMMSLVTGARYTWLTDDSGIGNPHEEPAVVCYQVTRLDNLLTRILTGELLGRRVEAKPEQIIRRVGNQDGGVCLDFYVTPKSAENATVAIAEPESPPAEGEAPDEGARPDEGAEFEGAPEGGTGDLADTPGSDSGPGDGEGTEGDSADGPRGDEGNTTRDSMASEEGDLGSTPEIGVGDTTGGDDVGITTEDTSAVSAAITSFSLKFAWTSCLLLMFALANITI